MLPFHRFLASPLTTCAALTALVFACRAWLIAEWGSPVPFWDQWGVEGALYRALLTDTLTWRELIAPHNEHRIVITKLADLALFVMCGGWNPWAQLLLNAILHAATAGVVAAMFGHGLPPTARTVFLAGVAVLFCATAGWQNALWAFQSQVYFTNLFAVIAFFGLARTVSQPDSSAQTHGDLRPPAWRRKLAWGWWLVVTALVLGVLSNAGGLFTAIVAAGFLLPRKHTRSAWLGMIVVLAIVALGAALRVSSPAHAALQAQTLEQFLAVFARGLSWPHVNSAWAWAVMQLPLPWLMMRRWRGGELTTADRCALALAAFAVLHAAAVAYSRGAGLPEFRPLSRYQDPLILGSAAQLYGAVRLAITQNRVGRLVLIIWLGVAFAGLIALTTRNLSVNLPFKRANDIVSLEQIRAYYQTNSANVFASGTSFSGPDSNPAAVIRVLDDPVLQPVLPAEFRDDIPLPWPIAHSRWLTCGTLVLFFFSLILSGGQRTTDLPNIKPLRPLKGA